MQNTILFAGFAFTVWLNLSGLGLMFELCSSYVRLIFDLCGYVILAYVKMLIFLKNLLV